MGGFDTTHITLNEHNAQTLVIIGQNMKHLVTYLRSFSYFCSKFNLYQKKRQCNLDYSNFIRFVKEKGEVHVYSKKDFFY